MSSDTTRLPGRRIVRCDYNALLLSIGDGLPMSGHSFFQVQDGAAVVRAVRTARPSFPILHIGTHSSADDPGDIPTLGAPFTPDRLLELVDEPFATATA